MSVALYIVEERKTPGLVVGVNGRALAHCKDLDNLARAANVRPMMEFYSYDPEWMAEFIEAEGGEMPAEGLQPEQWFPAEEGLRTVRGLIGLLAADLGRVANAEAVLDDLREFEVVLTRLARAGVRWHLSVDF